MSGLQLFVSILLALIVGVGLIGCDSEVERIDSRSNISAPTAAPIKPNVNSNHSRPPNLAENVNTEEMQRLANANEAFEVVPEEFRYVDFSNFKFPFGSLLNGELVIEGPGASGTIYSLGQAYYLDLAGDSRKEAVVWISEVSCGGSCDGGAPLIYFYAQEGKGVRRIGELKFGPPAYECSLKSITFSREEIEIEQFGRCTKSTDELDKGISADCKFCVTDITHSRYTLTPSGPKRKSIEVRESGTVNVMNYPAAVKFVAGNSPE